MWVRSTDAITMPKTIRIDNQLLTIPKQRRKFHHVEKPAIPWKSLTNDLQVVEA